MLKQKESEIQKAICDYLAYKNYFFWRSNNIPVFDPGKNGGFRAMPKYSMKGIPDIIIVKNGTVIFLEVKTPVGVMSDSQLEFQKKCILEKVNYHVVKSIDDVMLIGL